MALYAFDGTWNSEKDAGRYDLNTNVVRFKDLYTGTKFFYKGVGTRHGTLGKLVGGAFGVGGHDRIEDATKDVARQFAIGDRDIDIVGFSRGAALAVHFANVIGDSGVTVNGIRENPAIRFLGVFDVVAAFGIPIDIGLKFNRINLGYKLGLAKAVQALLPRARARRIAQGLPAHARARRLRSVVPRRALRRGRRQQQPRAQRHLTAVDAAQGHRHRSADGHELRGNRLHAPRHRREDRRELRQDPEPRRASPRRTTASTTRWRMRARHVNPPDPCTRETELAESQL